MTRTESISTPHGLVSKGDSIWHVGAAKDERLSVEELRVIGFKRGRRDEIVLSKKPELRSLGLHPWGVDKKEIKTNQISHCYSRCWFFYKRSDAIMRIKSHLDKEQSILEIKLSLLADQYNQLASLEIIP